MLRSSRTHPRGLAAFATLGLLAVALGVSALSSGAQPTDKTNRYILCLNKQGTAYVPKVKPHRCAIYGRHGSFAGGVNLKQIHWHNWGHGRARAKAIECGFHLPCEHIRAHVRVRRLRGRCRRKVYPRLEAHTKFGTSRPRPPGCPGPAF